MAYRQVAILAAAACVLGLVTRAPAADWQVEKLGRGVVAIRQDERRVFVSWRMLGTDVGGVAFNVYRTTGDAAPVKLNATPLTGPTHFVDESADVTKPNAYVVRPIVGGTEADDAAAAAPFKLAADAPARPYLSIPLQTPSGYAPNDASAGDLDGDGEYDIVLHQAGRGRDNSRSGRTDPPILQAYKLDGTLLWRINLGRNIREGAHYTQFLVYDLDGDGRAEVACKTADGTTDAKGVVIGDAKADYVADDGHVLRGPEFLTVFDGLTGAALATTKYVPARTNDGPEEPDPAELRSLWGDNRGNRSDRYLAAVAYLDGKRPSLVMCRGYYTRSALAAWDFKGGKLTQRWVFDTGAERRHPYAGQGNHNLSVADVDGDGRDEIVYGGMCVDDDGKGLWTSGLGHGDAMHVGDLDPDHPGLEVFRIQERFDDAGAHLLDARTGEVLWRKPSVKAADAGGDKGEGPGRGVAFDIDPRTPGVESWTAGAGIQGMWDAKGKQIGDTKPPSCNFAVWWDGDPIRELLDKNHVSKWNPETQKADRIFTADGCTSVNGTKANPSLSADLLGDWREEIIWPTEDGKELRVYVSTIATEYRMPTLMHDRQYRLAVAWQNIAYNQPPHPSFDMMTRVKR